MPIYTRKGDSGATRLFSGEQIGKDDLRVEAYGTLDELQAQLGVCRALTLDQNIGRILLKIEQDLVMLAAEVASTPESATRATRRIDEQDIQDLEALIDQYTGLYGLPAGFVLPGRSHDSAVMHVGRTICRRCERLLVALFQIASGRSQVLAYVNRLSDLLFILAWALEVRAVVMRCIQEHFLSLQVQP